MDYYASSQQVWKRSTNKILFRSCLTAMSMQSGWLSTFSSLKMSVCPCCLLIPNHKAVPGSVGGRFGSLHNHVGERGSSQMLAELRAIFPVGSPDTIGIHPPWNYLNFILKNSLSSKLRRYPNREMVCSRHNQHKSKGISSSRWTCPAC